MTNEPHSERRHRPSPWELAPAWIAAIGTLIAALAATGFFIGRASNQPQAANVPTSPASSSASSPSSAPTSAAPTPAAPTAGTVLASYSFTIEANLAVVVGDRAPTQDQFNSTGDGDLEMFFATFIPIGTTNKLIALDQNPAPTYQLCKTSTLFTRSVPIGKGTTFCLAEAGQVAGITVTSFQPSKNVATVNVVMWSDPAA